MSKFIANPENLKLMMNMLRDKSKNIQFEAFHVFKVCPGLSHCIILALTLRPSQVFVANPTKTKPILDILLKNKDKVGVVWQGGVARCDDLQMLDYLGKFHNDRDDEQFADEKQYLIKQIKDLQ